MEPQSAVVAQIFGGFGSGRGDGGISSSGIFSSRSNRTNLLDTWVPLNPTLARRYYDTFKNSWIIQACHREKIKAGFTGGFDIMYGPDGNREYLSSMSTPSSSSRRSKRKKGKEKVTKAYSDATKDTIYKEEIQWIEDTMKRAEMYRDVVGIVAFRPSITPRGAVRFQVVDITLGYFVGRITEDFNIEYGFRYYQPSGVSGLFPTNKRQYSGTSMFINGGAAQHEPDPSVHVYTWAGYEPDVGTGSPFKSTVSVLYQNALDTSEIIQNEMDGHYKMTHPVFVTEEHVQKKLPMDQTEHELLLEVAGQLKAGSTHEFYYRNRVNAEMSVHLSNTMRTVNDKNMNKRRRVIGLNLDGTETTRDRHSAWQDNMFMMPSGTKIGRGPDAKVRSDIVNILKHKASEVATVFGVPIPGITGGLGGGSKSTKTGTRSELDMFRRTLVEMRLSMTRFFESAYMTVVGKAENLVIANILSDIGVGVSNEESMVRSYIRNVLKRSDGGIGTSGKNDVQDAPSIDRTMGGQGENAKGGSDVGNPAEITLEDAEQFREEKMRHTLEKAAFERAEENRKIFRPSIEGPAVSSDVPIPPTQYKEPVPKRPRSYGVSKLTNVNDTIGERRGGEYIPQVEEWNSSAIPRASMANMDRWEREIQDMLSQQKFLERIEDAKWHRYMQDQHTMEQRVSRIMYTALTNYGVTLNPDAIRRSLKKEIEKDPSLNNTFGADITDPNDIVENFLVDEMMGQRKGYLRSLLDESSRIKINWISAPMPDVEMLIMAAEKGLGIPPIMVGEIIAEEMGIGDKLKEYIDKQHVNEKELEAYAKSKGAQMSAISALGEPEKKKTKKKL